MLDDNVASIECGSRCGPTSTSKFELTYNITVCVTASSIYAPARQFTYVHTYVRGAQAVYHACRGRMASEMFHNYSGS